MSDETKGGCLVVVGFAFVCGLIVASTYVVEYACDQKWQSEAIARGVAGYDEQTGEWKWTAERKVAE